MAKREYKCLLVSDFNVDNLASYLLNDENLPKVKPIIAPYGQTVQVLMDDNLECWQEHPDFALIWTQPQSIIESFNQLLNYENVAANQILEEVDSYCSLIANAIDRVRCTLIPMWVLPSYHRGYGMLDMRNGIGISNALMRMNLRIADNLDKRGNVYILNTQKWTEHAGDNAFNPKLWYMAKVVFGKEVFQEAVKDIKSALIGILGSAKKLILLDLDDTLWGGIIGDEGWENIRLGGHDSIGEAFVDFQKELKSLKNRGVLLGIVSKNEESVALEAIQNHPEMVLRSDDFVGWRINWADKAMNIAELVSDLNLGIDSVVFIDDNPVERDRVKKALPEVLVPEWPNDKMLYKKALLDLRCFDTHAISAEDRDRTEMYISERQRTALKQNIGSLSNWLGTLDTKVKVEELNEANLPRTNQLLNRTNQMNLSTRRMTESELASWVNKEGRKLWTFRVSDKFGDLGLTGIISMEREGNKAKITDFILSCRVMGRDVEETMIYTLVNYAKSLGLDEVWAEYLPTAKNKPCLDFFQNSGFVHTGNNNFSWQLCKDYRKPKHIKLIED
jgi:FkbH-like protein